MTIEEAIEHCKEQAVKLRKDSAKRLQIGLMHAANDCEECAAEHEQLAEWLTELKQRREAEITAPPKSNGDRIRQMTDEELAEWFAPHMKCGICANKNNPIGCTQKECIKYALEYMKKEANER